MKKTIKYLDNDGNYQYATVKDAGDLDKLKTKAKEDLVSAINELATNGIAAGNIDEINNKVDQIQQQVNQNADALNMSDQERQEMQQQIAQMQAEVQAKVAEMQKLAEEQNKKLQEASAELKKKADAIDVQKMQQDNAEALKNSTKALEDSLAATNEDLQKTADHLNEMEIQAGVVETSVKELQNGFESKVSSADFNEARTKLQEQETMVRQLNNELSTKASNNELDMVTQRVQKAESDIQQNAQGIKASVTKETMYKEMDDFAKYRENRLKYSRDFSNDWSLNGNDIIDDDHLFDTQHDVKSVSIRNGAYLTQTTDLDTDDMSKTFTLAMWVEKGKKPRAWYGSAELTNMKVKEDKGDYQRVYWMFVPTIVKQDIRITGDTSTQGNLIISEPKLEQSDRPSVWSTNTGDQYATTEKLAHDLKLTADKLESTITKQSEFSDRQLQDESRITQTEHGLEVANKTIVSKTDGLRQEFDGKIDATSKSLTTEYQSFTNRALGQMADGGANLILNSSFGSLKNSFDKWTDVNPKARIVTDDNGLKWVKLEQSGLTADSPIGLTSNLFRVKKGIVTVALDIRTDNAGSIDNDNIVILESYSADQKRVFTKNLGFNDFKITRETLFDHGSHRVTYKYNQTRDDTQYMAVHIVLPKNGVLYVTNVLARTVANGEDSGEYAPNAADLREQVVQQRTRIEQNDQAIALKADQTKVTQDIDAAKSSLSGAISKVEQRAANLEVKADGITSSVSTLSKTIDGISVGGTNLLKNSAGPFQPKSDGRIDNYQLFNSVTINMIQGHQYTVSGVTNGIFSDYHDGSTESDRCVLWLCHYDRGVSQIISSNTTGHGTTFIWNHPTDTYTLRVNTYHPASTNKIKVWNIKIESGNKKTDWSPAPEDIDSNISALESRASKLEQTDSEIKATVTSVTNDLKNGKATLKEGIMSMTDDHFSTKFSSIDNKIDGISVGGTNLVKTTSKNLYQQNVTGTWYYIASSVSHDNFDLTQYKGETISARAWIDKPSADAHLHIWTDNGMAAGNTIKAGQSGYSTITGWKVPTSFNDWNVPIGNGSPLTMGIKEIKIEKGNKPTDWSPAPEDTSAEIKSAKDAAIQVASDQINLHVNELSTSFDDKLNKRVNEAKTASEKFTSDGIEQVVTKVTNVKNDVDRLGDTIDGIQVGGTNVLKNTDPDSFSTTESDHTWTLESAGNGHGTIVDLDSNFSARHGFGIIGNTGGNKDFNQHPMHWNGGKYVFTVYIRLAPETNQTSVTALIRAWNYTKGTESYTRMIAIKSREWQKLSLEIDSSSFYKDDCSFSFGVTGIGSLNFAEPMLVTGTKAMDWSPAPEDISQQITNTNKKIDTQTLDAANIDELKTQGHYFVKNLTGNPIGGWVYVDVTGNNNDRVKQDVYQDNGGKHMSRRLFGDSWSGWEQGAYISDVNNAKTEVTASVKNLGDRVTTEVNSITTRQNNFENEAKEQHSNDVELVRKSDFEDGSKGSWTVNAVVSATNPAPPDELGQSGMKVLQTNVRDSYEEGIWYSVKPGEKFNVDFWCAPSSMYDSSFGLVFYDANKNLVPNNQWLGVRTDHSGQWKHYTGEIIAPSNSAFAKPWFQIDKPTDQHNTSWLAKPHIRRQDPRVTEAIKEINTKWDVANGQIQGKVTATDVNNILNGKGYATQSWAQTMFTMKSDAITLQAVRDNITNGIQNQVNDAKSQINSANGRINDTNNRLDNLKVGGRNLLKGTSDFWRSLTGSGWLGFTTALDMYTSVADYHSGDQFTYSATITNPSTVPVRLVLYCYGANKQEKIKTVLGPSVGPGAGSMAVSVTITMDSQTWFIRSNIESLDGKSPQTTIQVKNEQLEFGNTRTSWTPNPNDVPTNNNIISKINVSPEKIRLLSNKIEIDGNTYIHGTLNVPEVILEGKSGQIDLSGGQGIDIKSSTGDNHVKLTSNDVRIGGNEFFNLINNQASNYYYNGTKLGAIGRNSLTGDDQIKGLDMYFAPGQNNSGSNFEGGTYLALGYDDPNGDTIIPQIRLNFRDYATSHTTFKKGISLEDDVYFHQNNVHISTHSTWWIDSNPNGQDGIYFANYKWNDSWQPNFYQPTLMAGHGGDMHGDSGLSFLWNSLKLFGTLDLTGTRIRVNNAIVTPVFGWVSWTKWQNVKHLAIVDYNGFGGYAMSADGSPVLFGRDNTFSLMPNAGGTETGRNTGMSRSGDKDWKSPVS